MSHTIINTLLAVANILVIVVLVRQKIALRKERDVAVADKDYYHELFSEAREETMQVKRASGILATAHQRELDALRAKHLEQCAEKQAETEMYMEAAARLKEENDALKVQLAAFKDVYTGGTPIKIEEG